MAKSLTPGIGLGSLPPACGPGHVLRGDPCMPPPQPASRPPQPQGQRAARAAAGSCLLRPAPGPAALTPRRAFGGCPRWALGEDGEHGQPCTRVPKHVPERVPERSPLPGLQPLPATFPAAPARAGSLQSPSRPRLHGEARLGHGQDLALAETLCSPDMYLHALYRQGKRLKRFETWQRRKPFIT